MFTLIKFRFRFFVLHIKEIDKTYVFVFSSSIYVQGHLKEIDKDICSRESKSEFVNILYFVARVDSNCAPYRIACVTVNQALNKPATQVGDHVTSGGDSLVAGRAVDGNVGTVSCTNKVAQPWWSVDLGSPMDVGRVCVVNHGDETSWGDTTVGQFHNCFFLQNNVKIMLS